MSSNTQALIGESFQRESQGWLSLKGIAEEVEAFEVQFEIEAASTAEPSIDEQLAALREQLTRIDLEQLGEEEKESLMSSMSKLLKR